MNTAPSASRRNVILTMETASTDRSGPSLSQTAKTEYLCICVLIDDGVEIAEACFEGSDQARVLGQFWYRLQPHDLIIGYDIDKRLAFLRQRAWYFDIIPSEQLDLRKIYAHDMLDTLTLWADSGDGEHLTKEQLASLLALRKRMPGIAARTARAGSATEVIVERCRQDVRLTFEAFLKITSQPLSELDEDLQFAAIEDPDIEVTVHSRD